MRDGLASGTVYHVLQDMKGTMWFATENGVSRFDGYRFQTFGIADGLPDSEILSVLEDDAGRIWLITLNGDLAFIADGHVYDRSDYDWIPRMGGVPVIATCLIDGRMCIGTTSRVMAFDENGIDTVVDGRVTARVPLEEFAPDGKLQFFSSMKEVLVWDKARGDYKVVDSIPDLLPEWRLFVTKSRRDILTKELISGLQRDSTLIRKAITAFRKVDSETMLMNIRREGEDIFWFCTNGNGLFRYDASNGEVDHYLQESTISMTFQDRGGNLWVCTLGDGIYFLREHGLELQTLGPEDGLPGEQIHALAAGQDGAVYVGFDRTALARIRQGEPIAQYVADPASRNQDRVKRLDYLGDGRFLMASDIGPVVFRPPDKEIREAAPGWGYRGAIRTGTRRVAHLLDDRSHPFTRPFTAAFKDQCILSPEEWYQASIVGLWHCRIEGDSLVYSRLLIRSLHHVAYSRAPEGLWVASLDSLWRMDGHTPHPVEFQDSLKRRISRLTSDAKGCLWIGTAGNGLFHLTTAGLKHYTTADGLPSNTITAIASDSSDMLWVGTDRGLCAFPAHGGAAPATVETFDITRGLADNFVNDVLAQDGRIWVATLRGLSFFDAGAIGGEPAAPGLEISQVQIRGRDTTIQASYALPWWQNSLRFALYDPKFTAVGYEYRLLGTDTSWIPLEEPAINFSMLAAGETYTLEMRSYNWRGTYSPVRRVGISIRQQFVRSFWFLFLVLTAVFGIAFWIIQIRRRNRDAMRRKENEYGRKLAQMRLASLKAQMNPHFLFNSLNSIQHLVTENDERATTRFVAKFARLMRRVVDHSQHDFITLEEELKVCNLYLELESMRLLHDFSAEIEVDPSLEPSQLYVPAMVLQPFLENAIWHGLMPKDSDRRLSLRVVPEPTGFACVVCDNGIGRAAAAELRVHKHKSASTGNFAERLRLLNQSVGEDAFGYEYEDLYNSRQQPTGTCVTLHFPVINQTSNTIMQHK